MIVDEDSTLERLLGLTMAGGSGVGDLAAGLLCADRKLTGAADAPASRGRDAGCCSGTEFSSRWRRREARGPTRRTGALL